MSARTAVLAWVVAAVVLPRAASAQARGDTLRLDVLQAAAERHDPRASQLAIRESQTALRLRTISDEKLPAFTGQAEAQYQSVVTEFPPVPGRPARVRGLRPLPLAMAPRASFAVLGTERAFGARNLPNRASLQTQPVGSTTRDAAGKAGVV